MQVNAQRAHEKSEAAVSHYRQSCMSSDGNGNCPEHLQGPYRWRHLFQRGTGTGSLQRTVGCDHQRNSKLASSSQLSSTASGTQPPRAASHSNGPHRTPDATPGSKRFGIVDTVANGDARPTCRVGDGSCMASGCHEILFSRWWLARVPWKDKRRAGKQVHAA